MYASIWSTLLWFVPKSFLDGSFSPIHLLTDHLVQQLELEIMSFLYVLQFLVSDAKLTSRSALRFSKIQRVNNLASSWCVSAVEAWWWVKQWWHWCEAMTSCCRCQTTSMVLFKIYFLVPLLLLYCYHIKYVDHPCFSTLLVCLLNCSMLCLPFYQASM